MSGWLYIIRNKDLYKIGITKNFENRMKKLKPDSIFLKFYTSEYINLEKYLHKRYKKFRIPQTEYFRLKDIHLREIKKVISKLNYPISITINIIIKSVILLLLLFFIIFSFISLKINELNTVIIYAFSLMERFSFVLSIISFFINSNKYLTFHNEFKFRITRFIIFLIFTICFKIAGFIMVDL